MVEGTKDGLDRLNNVRSKLRLGKIPDVSDDNVSALRFNEVDLELFLMPLFEMKKQYFGIYYLISRVLHKLIIAPKEPRFDAKINELARKITEILPSISNMGHMVAYKLTKKEV